MSKKLTTEDFIQKAHEVHGDKYDYTKSIYTKRHEKLIITCPVHGDFVQEAGAHLCGQGCPKCGRLNTINKQKDTLETFINKAKKVHNNKYDYSKVNYINSKTPIKIICPIHGEFQQVPIYHTQGSGCPKCAHFLTTEKFIQKAKEIHNNKYDYSKVVYENTDKQVCIICPEHGEFWQTPHEHLRGHGCQKCARESNKIAISYTKKDFIEKSNKIHNNKYNYSKVKYIDSKTPVEIICPKHGSFWQRPQDHYLNECGCPKCTLKSQTKLYERLKEAFLTEEILFEVGNSVVTWLELQRFDIYFPKYNIAVEYNGIQHYIPIEHFGGKLDFESTLKRDELKRQKCKENNCTLFEVKYDYTEKDYQKLVENIQNIINNYDRSKEN